MNLMREYDDAIRNATSIPDRLETAAGRPPAASQKKPSAAVVRKPVTGKPSAAVVRNPVTGKTPAVVVRKPSADQPSAAVVRKSVTGKPSAAVVRKPFADQPSAAAVQPVTGKPSAAVVRKPPADQSSAAVIPAGQKFAVVIPRKPSTDQPFNPSPAPLVRRSNRLLKWRKN